MIKNIFKWLTVHVGVTAGILIALILIAVYGLSWIITCGLIKLITLCFGWTFDWAIATGIWLVMCLARSVFKSNVNVKK